MSDPYTMQEWDVIHTARHDPESTPWQGFEDDGERAADTVDQLRAELAEARGEVARLRGMLRDASAGMRRFGSLLRLIGKQDDNAGALVEGNTAYERADEIDAALTPPPAAPEEVDGAQS